MFKDTTLLGTLNLTLSNTYRSNSVDRESTYSQQEEPKLNKEEDKEIGPLLAHILPPPFFPKPNFTSFLCSSFTPDLFIKYHDGDFPKKRGLEGTTVNTVYVPLMECVVEPRRQT